MCDEDYVSHWHRDGYCSSVRVRVLEQASWWGLELKVKEGTGGSRPRRDEQDDILPSSFSSFHLPPSPPTPFVSGEKLVTWPPNPTVLSLLVSGNCRRKSAPHTNLVRPWAVLGEGSMRTVVTWATMTWGNRLCPYGLVAWWDRRRAPRAGVWRAPSSRGSGTGWPSWPLGSCGPWQIVLFFVCLASI